MGLKFEVRLLLSLALLSWLVLISFITWRGSEIIAENGAKAEERALVANGRDLKEVTSKPTRKPPPKDPILSRIVPQEPGVSNVLIVSSNPRSGSSFLADVLTPNGTESLYLFEPLRWLAERPPPNETPLDRRRKEQLKKLGSPETTPETIFRNVSTDKQLVMLWDLFTCNYRPYWDLILSDKARKFVFREPTRGLAETLTKRQIQLNFIPNRAESECRNTDIRLIKVIRARLDSILSSSLVPRLHLKLILIVRDPRAILSSLLVSPDTWEKKLFLPSTICNATLMDMKTYDEIKDKKLVYLLKYEDLVSDRNSTLQNVSFFLNQSLEFSEKVVLDAQEHSTDMKPYKLPKRLLKGRSPRTQAVSQAKNRNSIKSHGSMRYYNTYRSTSFDPHEWKKLLSKEAINRIQDEPLCQWVFHRLNYEVLE